jgi:hypothetical protein
MRMQTRSFSRLTKAFSKKFENHFHFLALYFVLDAKEQSRSHDTRNRGWPY